jgi:D-beta-D-heptose 7-phosphate kinase/D-beta-D-heptose 1-phosphate adenosyltransferase
MNQIDVPASFAHLTALVAGDAILDTFVIGTAERLCREQPVPIVVKGGTVSCPGGAANAAANLRALGAEVRFVTLVASDEGGRELCRCLERMDVALDWLTAIEGARTAHKMRILAGDHYLARVDETAYGFNTEPAQERMQRAVQRAAGAFDVALISDYGGGCVSPKFVRRLEALCERRGHPLVIDAKDVIRYRNIRRCILTPNLDEACRAVCFSSSLRGERSRYELAERMRENFRAAAIVITMGGDGVLIVDETCIRHVQARRVAVHASVGAGDSFAAALALSLCSADLQTAASVALEAAAVAVAKPFTATVSNTELRERLDLVTTPDEAGDLYELERILPELERRRAAGARIVLTNGVFDLLHEGHIEMLRRGRELGDLLVVAVNSDRSARTVKGPDRPINSLRHRQSVLQALHCVDYVVAFDETTAEHVVERLRPHVYVHGDDRPLEELPEATRAFSIGSRVVFLPRSTSLTTTRIIERVTARSPDWAPR